MPACKGSRGNRVLLLLMSYAMADMGCEQHVPLVRAVSCAVTVMLLPCGYESPVAPVTAPVTVNSNGRGTVKYLRPESPSKFCPTEQQLRSAEHYPGNKTQHSAILASARSHVKSVCMPTRPIHVIQTTASACEKVAACLQVICRTSRPLALLSAAACAQHADRSAASAFCRSVQVRPGTHQG